MHNSFLIYFMDEYQSKISFISDILLQQSDSKLNLLLQNLIQKHQLDHSCNTNGIFLNLSTLDPHVLEELHTMVINYSMETYKPEVPMSNPSVKSVIPDVSKSPIKKETLSLSKFDKVLLGLSKQKLSI